MCMKFIEYLDKVIVFVPHFWFVSRPAHTLILGGARWTPVGILVLPKTGPELGSMIAFSGPQ
jgi:hypothetical protein